MDKEIGVPDFSKAYKMKKGIKITQRDWMNLLNRVAALEKKATRKPRAKKEEE